MQNRVLEMSRSCWVLARCARSAFMQTGLSSAFLEKSGPVRERKEKWRKEKKILGGRKRCFVEAEEDVQESIQ